MGPEFLIVTLILVLGVGGTIFWVLSLIEVVRTPDQQFAAAGAEKLVWVLVVALAGWLGALIWWFAVRSSVRAAAGPGLGGAAAYGASIPGPAPARGRAFFAPAGQYPRRRPGRR